MQNCDQAPGQDTLIIIWRIEDTKHVGNVLPSSEWSETTIDNTTILMEVSSFLKAEVADSFLKGLSINDVTQKIIQSF